MRGVILVVMHGTNDIGPAKSFAATVVVVFKVIVQPERLAALNRDNTV